MFLIEDSVIGLYFFFLFFSFSLLFGTFGFMGQALAKASGFMGDSQGN